MALFQQMPTELLFEIFCHCDYSSVLTGRLACKWWFEVSKMDGIWKSLFSQIFGKEFKPGKLPSSWYVCVQRF
jgi:hypothetical protein